MTTYYHYQWSEMPPASRHFLSHLDFLQKVVGKMWRGIQADAIHIKFRGLGVAKTSGLTRQN